jgi:hypothetical protein
MIHPYWTTADQDLKDEHIPKYKMILKMCTLYKGVPKGPAIISFNCPFSPFMSFEGVGTFTDGLLEGGSFLCQRGDGTGILHTVMKKGRPADDHYGSIFTKQGGKLNIYSVNETIDVSGWAYYSG